MLFDSNLSFDSHVSSICKTEFFHLKNISKLRPMLTMSNAEMLIHAFMTSMLDYCNALLGGYFARLINKLQMVRNSAAKILTRTRKYDHISPVLSTLHWLPNKHRIVSRSCCCALTGHQISLHVEHMVCCLLLVPCALLSIVCPLPSCSLCVCYVVCANSSLPACLPVFPLQGGFCSSLFLFCY